MIPVTPITIEITPIAMRTAINDYLIITVDHFADHCKRFSRHKRSQGFSPIVCTLSCQDKPEAKIIRDTIRQYHGNGARYVLLVGNEKHIPVTGIPGYNNFPR